MGDITEKRRRDYSGLDADKASIPAGGKAVNDTFLATDTKILYFWDGVAWIIIPLDVIVAGMIKTDAVETLKIKDLNVTKAKAELGFGRYVTRDVTAGDFAVGDFTRDGNWHVDGLDISGIVPEGAIAAHLRFTFRATAADKVGALRANATDKADNRCLLNTQVANLSLAIETFLNIDANRLLDYNFDAQVDNISITVMGWFI